MLTGRKFGYGSFVRGQCDSSEPYRSENLAVVAVNLSSLLHFVHNVVLLHRVGRTFHSVTLDRQHSLSAGQLEQPRGLWSQSEACGGASTKRGRGYALQMYANVNTGTRKVFKVQQLCIQASVKRQNLLI